MFMDVAQRRKEESGSSSFVRSYRCVGVGQEEEKEKDKEQMALSDLIDVLGWGCNLAPWSRCAFS